MMNNNASMIMKALQAQGAMTGPAEAAGPSQDGGEAPASGILDRLIAAGLVTDADLQSAVMRRESEAKQQQEAVPAQAGPLPAQPVGQPTGRRGLLA